MTRLLPFAALALSLTACADKADPKLFGKTVQPPGIGKLAFGASFEEAQAALPGSKPTYARTLTKTIGEHADLVLAFNTDNKLDQFRVELPHETCLDTMKTAWGPPTYGPINSVDKKYPQWESDQTGWFAYVDDLGKHLGCTLQFESMEDHLYRVRRWKKVSSR